MAPPARSADLPPDARNVIEFRNVCMHYPAGDIGLDGATFSVKSSDGFTQTWTFGDKLKVVQGRKAADKSLLKTGAEVGVAGQKDGDRAVARLVAVKRG